MLADPIAGQGTVGAAPNGAVAVGHGHDRPRETPLVHVAGSDRERGIKVLGAHRGQRYAEREPGEEVRRPAPMRASRLLCAVLAFAVAGCQEPAAVATPTSVPSATPAPSVAGDAILVTVDVTGGECPSGPCGAEYVVYVDGRVDGPADGARAISKDQMDLIAAEVGRTNWDVVRSVPFTSMCPTAYDGQKRVYAFPLRGGDVVVDSCELDLSRVRVVRMIDAALFGG